MTPEAVLRQVIGALERAGIEYMLTGSFASSYHGVPRATQDIDLVIDGNEDQILGFARELSAAGFYVSEVAATEAVSLRGPFNVIDQSTGWKVDLILRRDRPFSRNEFSRRTLEEAFGFPLFVATAEDTLLAKLEWSGLVDSEQQLRDAVGIVRSQGERLDRAYIRRWARELGLMDQWERVSERAGLG